MGKSESRFTSRLRRRQWRAMWPVAMSPGHLGANTVAGGLIAKWSLVSCPVACSRFCRTGVIRIRGRPPPRKRRTPPVPGAALQEVMLSASCQRPTRPRWGAARARFDT